MSGEFTGERAIPGQIDTDLWNEHIARYVWTSRLAGGKRILDIACGSGYGSAAMATDARSVTGLDVAADALDYASANYRRPGLNWVQGSGTHLPFAAGSFDLVVAFEVIEHLAEPGALIAEARRVLAPDGTFVVSTPNKLFYAETRRESGPNPFHLHEFEYQEFVAALGADFPHVSIYLQDHAAGLAFRPAGRARGGSVFFEKESADPELSGFYLAICRREELRDDHAFFYVPGEANALREKLVHIDRLNGEVDQKNRWLADAQASHAALLDQHRSLIAAHQKSNEWAAELDRQLGAAQERVASLQDELTAEQRHGREIVAGYESKIAELESQGRALAADLQGRVAELGRCVEILHQTEAERDQQTTWAMDLDAQRAALEAQRAELETLVAAARHSRWVKLGRAVGLGPELVKS